MTVLGTRQRPRAECRRRGVDFRVLYQSGAMESLAPCRNAWFDHPWEAELYLWIEYAFAGGVGRVQRFIDGKLAGSYAVEAA